MMKRDDMMKIYYILWIIFIYISTIHGRTVVLDGDVRIDPPISEDLYIKKAYFSDSLFRGIFEQYYQLGHLPRSYNIIHSKYSFFTYTPLHLRDDVTKHAFAYLEKLISHHLLHIEQCYISYHNHFEAYIHLLPKLKRTRFQSNGIQINNKNTNTNKEKQSTYGGKKSIKLNHKNDRISLYDESGCSVEMLEVYYRVTLQMITKLRSSCQNITLLDRLPHRDELMSDKVEDMTTFHVLQCQLKMLNGFCDDQQCSYEGVLFEFGQEYLKEEMFFDNLHPFNNSKGTYHSNNIQKEENRLYYERSDQNHLEILDLLFTFVTHL